MQGTLREFLSFLSFGSAPFRQWEDYPQTSNLISGLEGCPDLPAFHCRRPAISELSWGDPSCSLSNPWRESLIFTRL